MRYILQLIPFFLTLSISAQKPDSWQGKQCAVVLTYDDGLNVDLTNAIPALDSLGLKGTFYIADYFGRLEGQIPKWKLAAAKGHELANHTIFHPCMGGMPGREFVVPEYDLNNYTFRRLTEEIKAMNALLKAIDGKTKRTFAFPCNDTKLHDTPYIDRLKDEFIAARAVRSEMVSLAHTDLYDLPSYMINGQSGDELIALVKEAMSRHSLLIFLFHGVGGDHALNVSLEAHSKLLHFLAQNRKIVWTAPMVDVAEYIRRYQTHKK